MKQKTILLVPAMYAKEMVPNADTEQKLAGGSYLIAAKPKKPSAHCIAQREYKQRQLEAGYRDFHTLLPEPVFNRLRAMLHKGESMAELVERLLSIADDLHISIGVEDK